MSRIDKIRTKLGPAIAALPKFASILVVDDQRFDRSRLLRLINGLEFDTHVVEADCLERMGTMLEADRFDLILVDFNLPDGTGLQAVDAIHLDPRNRQAATIMIAGEGQNDIAIEALKRGCSDYITKDDLTPDSFRRAVINALQKSHLSIGIEQQDTKRQEMEALLQKFSSECALEIKPVVSRMMRQLRDLRDAPDLSAEQRAERFDRVEQSCMRLWEFLEDLEGYQGTDLAADTCKDADFFRSGDGATSDASGTAKPRRVQASKRQRPPG